MSGDEKCPACETAHEQGYQVETRCTGRAGCVRYVTPSGAPILRPATDADVAAPTKISDADLIDLMSKVDDLMIEGAARGTQPAAGTEGGADIVTGLLILSGAQVRADSRDRLRAAADEIARLRADVERLKAEAFEAWGRKEASLADPNAVHVNLLRGSIARPTWDQIRHVYAGESHARDVLAVKAGIEAAAARHIEVSETLPNGLFYDRDWSAARVASNLRALDPAAIAKALDAGGGR